MNERARSNSHSHANALQIRNYTIAFLRQRWFIRIKICCEPYPNRCYRILPYPTLARISHNKIKQEVYRGCIFKQYPLGESIKSIHEVNGHIEHLPGGEKTYHLAGSLGSARVNWKVGRCHSVRRP